MVMFAALIVTTVSAQSTLPTPGSVIAPIDQPVLKSDDSEASPLEQEEQEKLKPPSSNKKIQIEKFVLVGNSLFDDEVLSGHINEFTGVEVTIEQIYEAADKLQRFYRNRGYLLASVYVPAQKVSSGTIRLEIIEGRIASVQIEGELESYEPKFLLEMFDVSNVGEIVSSDLLEQKILSVNALPGLEARTVIVPGNDYGTSDLYVQAIEDPVSAVIRVNNYGRRSLGENRVEAGWLYVNPFSQGDQINLSAIVAEDSRMNYLRADYDALVTNSGMRAGASVSMFEYDVDAEEINLFGVLEGDGTNFRAFVSYPFILQQRNKLDFSVAVRTNETGEEGSLAVSTDTRTIDLLDLSLRWQPAHDNGSFSDMTVTYTSNFKDNEDGSESDAVNSKVTLDYRFIVPFAATWFTQLHFNLVSSADPLPDVERYRLGGPGNIRAYPATEIAGDEGHMIRVDVGKRFKWGDKTTIIGRVFADTGEVERIIPFAGEDSDETLSGYGAGLLLDFNGKHSLEIEVATPTSDLDASDDEDTRLWLNYAVQL